MNKPVITYSIPDTEPISELKKRLNEEIKAFVEAGTVYKEDELKQEAVNIINLINRILRMRIFENPEFSDVDVAYVKGFVRNMLGSTAGNEAQEVSPTTNSLILAAVSSCDTYKKSLDSYRKMQKSIKEEDFYAAEVRATIAELEEALEKEEAWFDYLMRQKENEKRVLGTYKALEGFIEDTGYFRDLLEKAEERFYQSDDEDEDFSQFEDIEELERFHKN